jgi:hypothetical protein
MSSVPVIKSIAKILPRRAVSMAQPCFQERKKANITIQHRDQAAASETVLANEISGEALASIHEREAARVAGDVTAARGAGEAAVSEAHLRMSGAKQPLRTMQIPMVTPPPTCSATATATATATASCPWNGEEEEDLDEDLVPSAESQDLKRFEQYVRQINLAAATNPQIEADVCRESMQERTPNARREAINGLVATSSTGTSSTGDEFNSPEFNGRPERSFNGHERLYSIELDKPRLVTSTFSLKDVNAVNGVGDWTSKVEAENAKAKEEEEQRTRVPEWQRPITYFFESIGAVNPQSQREVYLSHMKSFSS